MRGGKRKTGLIVRCNETLRCHTSDPTSRFGCCPPRSGVSLSRRPFRAIGVFSVQTPLEVPAPSSMVGPDTETVGV